MVQAIGDEEGIAGRIARELTNLIIRGKLAAGVRLREPMLAKMFGASRTPVREAIRKLEQSALVVVTPRLGARVATISAQTVRDSYICRAYLHGLSIRLVCERAERRDLQVMEKILSEMEVAARNESVDEYFRPHVAFHDATVAMNGNEVLEKMIEQLGLTTLRLRYLSLTIPGRIQSSYRAHERVMQSLRLGDPEGAEMAVRNVILDARDVLLEHYFRDDSAEAGAHAPCNELAAHGEVRERRLATP